MSSPPPLASCANLPLAIVVTFLTWSVVPFTHTIAITVVPFGLLLLINFLVVETYLLHQWFSTMLTFSTFRRFVLARGFHRRAVAKKLGRPMDVENGNGGGDEGEIDSFLNAGLRDEEHQGRRSNFHFQGQDNDNDAAFQSQGGKGGSSCPFTTLLTRFSNFQQDHHLGPVLTFLFGGLNIIYILWTFIFILSFSDRSLGFPWNYLIYSVGKVSYIYLLTVYLVGAPIFLVYCISVFVGQCGRGVGRKSGGRFGGEERGLRTRGSGRVEDERRDENGRVVGDGGIFTGNGRQG